MPKPYFRNVPNFDYINRFKGEQQISNYVRVKNFFKRGKLREDIFENLSYFEAYQIEGDERPDQIAYRIYNDSTLDWVILITNNILNMYNEWPMSQNVFDNYLLEKYGSYEDVFSGIHHYKTIPIKTSLGHTIIPENFTLSNNWQTNGNYLEYNNTPIAQIFAGNGVESSTTITVTLNNGIYNLKVGSEVIIANVTEEVYSGKFTVTSVSDPFGDNYIRSFTYELESAPDVVSPILSSNNQEQVLVLLENSTVSGNTYYFEYYDYGLGYYVSVPSTSFLLPVTNYEYELELEDNKRNIFVLKPEYLPLLFNDIDTIMPYKEGGAQYVSRTLKKGDNYKLTR